MAGRWLGWARDMVRVLRVLPDVEIRQKTAAMHQELMRLRQHRAEYEREREASALNNIRKIVAELKTLEQNLQEAEQATADYVATIAEEVSKEMETKMNAEMDQVVKAAMSARKQDSKDLPDSESSTSYESPVVERPPSKSKQ